MADFHNAFEAIDEDGSGEITVEELQHYMIRNNYKDTFVTKWLTLFDGYKSGTITYEHYCNTLGLVPRDRPIVAKQAPALTAPVAPAAATTAATEEPPEDIIMPVATPTESAAVEAPTSVDERAQKRTVKRPQSYPVQSAKRAPKHRGKPFSHHKRRLRASIRPGVVLILLTGVHRGKRVVFLKQLPSGLLLVTGPFKINGCPLRRVHQSLVIATRTQVGLGEFDTPEHLSDDYFARRDDDNKRTHADPSNIFARAKKQYVLKETRKQDQKLVDSHILAAIKKRVDKATLVRYLRSPFTLSSHDYPHKMQF